MTIVSDSTAANFKAGEVLEQALKAIRVEFSAQNQQVGCILHYINLAVQDILKFFKANVVTEQDVDFSDLTDDDQDDLQAYGTGKLGIGCDTKDDNEDKGKDEDRDDTQLDNISIVKKVHFY